MKKLLAIVLAACLALTLVACGGAPSSTPASGSASGSTAAAVSGDANVAVFYYTYSDTYISSVRSALDAKLDEMGVTYQDFDGAGQQTTQTEQVTIAAVRTPKSKPKASPLLPVISLLQEIADSGQKLPKRELNELTRAVDRLWGRLQDKG